MAQNYTGTFTPLTNFKNTVDEIIKFADTYWPDLLLPNKLGIDFRKLTAPQAFHSIKSILYVPDPAGVEYISRPMYLLAFANTDHPFDCDDRTIMTRAYLRLQNYLLSGDPNTPFIPQVKVTGRGDIPHHVFTVFSLPSAGFIQRPFDPTYPINEYGKELFPARFTYIK